jgi:hypothetical protein
MTQIVKSAYVQCNNSNENRVETSGRNNECYRENSPLSMLQRDVSSFGFIASFPGMRAMITRLEEESCSTCKHLRKVLLNLQAPEKSLAQPASTNVPHPEQTVMHQQESRCSRCTVAFLTEGYQRIRCVVRRRKRIGLRFHFLSQDEFEVHGMHDKGIESSD